MTFSRNSRLFCAVYLFFLAAYAGASGARLRAKSSDTHFNYLASMWLHGRLDLGLQPPNQNDWAEVEYLKLKDGTTIAGTFIRSSPETFRSLDGKRQRIAATEIESRFKKFYVSFPPFPAVLFVPFVAVFGLAFNDVLFNVLLAPFAPALLLMILRRLRARGDSERSESDDLWLTAMFGVGTVFFYSSVIGQVWYTAHIVSTVLAGLFVLASLGGRHPFLAGAALAALTLTRPQMAFFGLLLLWELRREARVCPSPELGRRRLLAKLALAAIPLALFGVVGAWFNWVRFHSLTEFGHFYLNVRWTDRIQRYGLFNYAFLGRNLAAAFTLTPKLLARAPYIQFPWHGLSMLITTPALGYLLWPRDRGRMHRILWLTVLPIALASFLYQNDGWVQFGFRFVIDYLLLLMMLLAVGNRRITRVWKALILFGVAVNLFGAISFGRMWNLYYDGFFAIGPGEL